MKKWKNYSYFTVPNWGCYSVFIFGGMAARRRWIWAEEGWISRRRWGGGGADFSSEVAEGLGA